MKQMIKYKYIYFLFILLLLAAGCKKDFLAVDPPDQIQAELVWKDPALAQAFVTDIYNGLSVGGFAEQMLSSVSDESLFTHPNRGIDLVNASTINPTTLGWVDDSWSYNLMYNRIRACNITIEKLSGTDNSITDQQLKDQLLGEAHFLRAYFYQQLVRYQGSVPLVTKSYALDDDFTIKRSTYEECINLIIKDCEDAIMMLRGKTLPSGRGSSLAAMALKSRVLLYAASDLHDIPTAKSKSPVISGYSNPEYLGYVSGDRNLRWKAALDAAKAVVDAGTGYRLNLSTKASAEEGRLNYKSVAMGGGSKAPGIDAAAASELILARYFIDLSDMRYGRANGPNGYHNWAGNTPIGLLVDDYEMADGTAFSWTNPAQKSAPYLNRDPRLYATILYDGAGWKPRDKVSGNVDPANQIQTGEYDLLEGGSVITLKGLDTRGSSIENWNGSWTGYYTQKFIDPDPNIVDANQPQFVPWPFFRYTEAVLNYIEASIELNQLPEAVLWLNRIRFRAGMPAVTAGSQSALRDIYRHERRIEMAYEEQRYHDTRRWMIAPETLGRKTTYIKITGKFKTGKTMSAPYHYDPSVYDYTYTPTTETAQEDRRWDDKIYFRPFSRDEINRNKDLKQNPGY
ncbi:Starch-binding associating with outer membrane [Pedobacter westerhofensis]|uniref:Starch-binding associating with outer membrane n=1 Tax=Pedobacter westerhofensis TaxID=425512 RepID=A0A521FG79_9SPHI|nr:RagB/SusD family nutrient uptake outer membrane protein [Pedobacter westerhofensis]SMO95197.1 Starch-binding associating with outer membrane [Pedobacter westerhofensis]